MKVNKVEVQEVKQTFRAGLGVILREDRGVAPVIALFNGSQDYLDMETFDPREAASRLREIAVWLELFAPQVGL